MEQLNIALVTVGGLVLVLGLLSAPIRRSILSEPLVALLVGVLLDPRVLDLLDLADWGRQELILEQAARLTLAIGLMDVALRLPKGDPIRRWRSLVVLLGLVMPLMWLASGLLVYLIIGLPFWVAMLLGAVVTPTDPIVSSAIVTGSVAKENLPDDVRHTLSAESGANDGLAYPFVLLPILLLSRPPGEALTEWATRILLWEVLGAVIFGAIAGYAAGRLLGWGESRKTVEETSFLVYTLALSLGVLGAGKLLGTDGILAVFIAGVAFDMAMTSEERQEEERVQEAVNRFFTLPIFVLLGLVLPWDRWADLGWRAPLLVVSILLLRRLPAVLALHPLLGRVRGLRNALFLGWFGPIGVAALFYANFALGRTGYEEVWTIASLLIAASVLAHGLTATPLTRLYGHRG